MRRTEAEMRRFAILLILIFCVGCWSNDDVVEGGTVTNTDRDKCHEYFNALAKVETVEEEGKLLTEFGEWLKKNGYKIVVEPKNGKHQLSCPYFPPVTPWIEHSFHDVDNLSLLPQDNARDGGG